MMPGPLQNRKGLGLIFWWDAYRAGPSYLFILLFCTIQPIDAYLIFSYYTSSSQRTSPRSHAHEL